jgi:YidC/Oxa1 family membrane protein insertase
MFETLVTRPVFNLLTFIYGILPGHNLGFAIIVFTLVIRFLLWPLLKKQLYNAKVMRQLQPEMKRIKAETKGNKQKEAELTMQLYKERGINPFGSIGTAILQLPILFALYHGITKIVEDPSSIVTFSYDFVKNLPWMQELALDISKLDMTLFGFLDLTRKPLGDGIYWPGMIVVLLSAVVQYYASKMLMVTDEEARGLRQILRDAGSGKEADQGEVNAAVMRMMRYIIPVFIFITSVNFAAALGLYWFVSGLIQYLQQAYVLRQDKQELTTASISGSEVVAEVIPPKNKDSNKKKKSKKKRR